ncbi:F-box domain-containing protein [Dothidotthia symphoricarpi CBS 119687]|uniref:F-box domain-containing protein n=1 Tax=Dothidotthia symphoricarpi CBS 119687 TaxID=1392245 RepID=A0A6A5ZZH2_9PLEO|nr:F-box domain-containing protein [Dothidotthia symphoricarpi CBS 119687]KAF2125142.1 F-box domain-containing protein [Dothidotthia symphoricarpi CBS 119687]
MMAECYLYRLPNELLLHILTPIPTPELLPLTVLSHRIYTLILRILHNRLVAAAELNSHSLLLECYHPSAKLTEPPYFCAYRGTDGLSYYENPYEADTYNAARLGEMRNMYSRFRPYRRELESGGRRVRPGDVPGSRTFPGTVQDKHEGETVRQTISLEAHELFTQLVAQTNLAKIAARNGMFTSFVEVEEGVLRVWRDWLSKMAAKSARASLNPQQKAFEVEGKGKQAVNETASEKVDPDDERILWLSLDKNTGIRFNVKERKFIRDTPILVGPDEDIPVAYELEYDEVFIRTSYLLLKLEKSMVQEDNASKTAVVFGSFG